MQCDVCGKNEATIHITEIVNGQGKELHVCQKCAEAENAKMEHSFDISDLLTGLVEFPGFVKKDKAIKCPSCGMTYSDFRRFGKLGCSNCYAAFNNVLLPLIKNIHGSTHHIGKEPEKTAPHKTAENKTKIKAPTKEERIAQLQERLQKAISIEEYEKAAALRDKIRALEKGEK